MHIKMCHAMKWSWEKEEMCLYMCFSIFPFIFLSKQRKRPKSRQRHEKRKILNDNSNQVKNKNNSNGDILTHPKGVIEISVWHLLSTRRDFPYFFKKKRKKTPQKTEEERAKKNKVQKKESLHNSNSPCANSWFYFDLYCLQVIATIFI